MRYGLLIIFTWILNLAYAQHPLLRSGPALGYVDHNRAYITVDPAPEVKEIMITWFEQGKPSSADSLTIERSKDDTLPVTFKIKGLQSATLYNLKLKLNGVPVIPGFIPSFRTSSPAGNAGRSFSFLFGSCLYLNDPGENKKHGDPAILDEMSKLETDFMIWGGDNMYLRDEEWNSEIRIAGRYLKTRRHPYMQKLLGTRANFAVCDDHDYGPDDCNGSNYNKAEASQAMFRKFWPVKDYASGKDKGIYHRFSWDDCDFFMMDDRSFRSDADIPGIVDETLNKDKKFYGRQQLQWLMDGLKNSDATFKFIVSGGQMINPLAEKECFRYYNYEYNKLLSFILSNRIEGVIFLSGDRHFTELIATQPEGGYTLFDFTCSSLTSPVRSIEKTKEIDNPYRIPGTLCMNNNFSKITVHGKKGDRKISIETKDTKGKPVWDFVIKESDVKFLKGK